MVNHSGQLYTIEGIAAGILMLTTAYLVISATSIYTPAETHISDMQLEQLGNDVLLAMDTPYLSPAIVATGQKNSELARFIGNNQGTEFNERFRKLITTNGTEDIRFISTIYFRNATGVHAFSFTDPGQVITNRERMVKVSRLVQINNPNPSLVSNTPYMDNRNQTVLLEVLLWRD